MFFRKNLKSLLQISEKVLSAKLTQDFEITEEALERIHQDVPTRDCIGPTVGTRENCMKHCVYTYKGDFLSSAERPACWSTSYTVGKRMGDAYANAGFLVWPVLDFDGNADKQLWYKKYITFLYKLPLFQRVFLGTVEEAYKRGYHVLNLGCNGVITMYCMQLARPVVESMYKGNFDKVQDVLYSYDFKGNITLSTLAEFLSHSPKFLLAHSFLPPMFTTHSKVEPDTKSVVSFETFLLFGPDEERLNESVWKTGTYFQTDGSRRILRSSYVSSLYRDQIEYQGDNLWCTDGRTYPSKDVGYIKARNKLLNKQVTKYRDLLVTKDFDLALLEDSAPITRDLVYRSFLDGVRIYTDCGRVFSYYMKGKKTNGRRHSCFGGWARIDTYLGLAEDEKVLAIQLPYIPLYKDGLLSFMLATDLAKEVLLYTDLETVKQKGIVLNTKANVTAMMLFAIVYRDTWNWATDFRTYRDKYDRRASTIDGLPYYAKTLPLYRPEDKEQFTYSTIGWWESNDRANKDEMNYYKEGCPLSMYEMNGYFGQLTLNAKNICKKDASLIREIQERV